MSWLYLVLAVIVEVAGTTFLKMSQGLTKLVPSILMFILYGLSIVGLAFAVKELEVSVAYAVWAGLGTALMAVVGILWFKEPANALKLVSIGLIIVGAVGLNLSGRLH